MAKAHELRKGGDAKPAGADPPPRALSIPTTRVVCPECGSASCTLLRARDVSEHLGVAVSSVYSMTCRQLLPSPLYVWRKGARRGGPRWRSCVLNAALSTSKEGGA
jgi:hypothetical protein